MSEVPLYLSLPLCFALSLIHFVHKHHQPQEVCKPECIIATNTSGLPVRKIAEHSLLSRWARDLSSRAHNMSCRTRNLLLMVARAR